MGLMLDKEQSLQQATDRLLNPQTEEPKEMSEAENPNEEDVVETTDSELVDENEDVLEEEEEASGEADAYEDDEEVDEDEDDGEGEEEELRVDTYTITVDGSDEEVTLDELRSGYQRNKDYTQKTQTLADERKSLDAEKAALGTERAKYIEATKQVFERQVGVLDEFESLDWAQLKEADPLEYVSKQADYLEAKRMATEQAVAIDAALTQEREQAAVRMQTYLAEQQVELEVVLPEMANADTKKALVDYALGAGYTEEDLGQLVRAKDVLTLHKARLYDESQKAKKEVASKKAPSKSKKRIKGKASTGKTTKQARKVKQKRDTLRKSGSLKDAAALLLDN